MTYTLPARQLPLDESFDVIVVGGGPAGCTAATAAAREGARTLLVEATGCLGGMGTAGLVPAWCPFSDKEKIIYRGLAERVFRETTAGIAHIAPERLDWVAIDPERLKRVYDDMVTEAGVTVLFNTAFIAVETQGDGVDVIILANKAGVTAYRAKVYVDGTGDGDLAVWAGAQYEQGEEGTGDLQPVTHCFILSNVDTYGYQYNLWGSHKAPLLAVLESGKYPLIPDRHFCNNLIGPGTVGFNSGHIWDVDNTDPMSVSKALIHGRKIAAQFRDGLAEFHPKAFGNAFLVATGSLMGIRETRRVIGDYLLTFEDYLARRSFPDEICRNSYPIDVHHPKEKIADNIAGNYHGMSHHYSAGESHGIPYRCLTPRGLRNVLIAGRSISTDRITQGSTRVMPTCLAMGEAAGIAAAHAATTPGNDVHAVDTTRLRARLIEMGGYLPKV